MGEESQGLCIRMYLYRSHLIPNWHREESLTDQIATQRTKRNTIS